MCSLDCRLDLERRQILQSKLIYFYWSMSSEVCIYHNIINAKVSEFIFLLATLPPTSIWIYANFSGIKKSMSHSNKIELLHCRNSFHNTPNRNTNESRSSYFYGNLLHMHFWTAILLAYFVANTTTIP